MQPTTDETRVEFSLRDLRTAKGISQKELARALGISPALYCSIEGGHRKPTIDTMFLLASLYKTSMDFIYHAFYRQHYIWHFPDDSLEYAMRKAKSLDVVYLRDHLPEPCEPPKLPTAIILEHKVS